MNEAAAVWFTGLDPAWLFALDVAAKAAMLCLLALLFEVVLGPRRVLVRSALWHAYLVGLLFLPWAAWVCPEWSITCLAGERPHVAQRAVVDAAVPADPFAEPLPSLADMESTALKTEVFDEESHAATTLVLALYLGGIAFFAMRLARDWRAVRAWLVTSRPVSDPRWTEALEHWSVRLGLKCDVQLVSCEKLSIPVVVGWWRPRVALPEPLAASAPRQTIDAVLLHELAHIGRGDYAWNVVWRLVQAAYWPHPLAWLVGRRLNTVREQACDEVCIYWMNDRQAYRTTLVELAAGLVRRPLGTLGLAMTRSTRLGRRLANIDAAQGLPRCVLRRPARWAVIGAVAAAFLAVATLQLVRTPLAAAQQSGEDKVPAAKEKQATAAAESDGADDNKASDDGRAANGPAPRQVRVAVVARQGAAKQTTQPVTLEAYQEVEIRAQIAGVVKEVSAQVGDVVKAGDALGELDVPELDEAVEEAQTALIEAKARREQAAAEVEAAQAALVETHSVLEGVEKEIENAKGTAAFRAIYYERIKKLTKAQAVEEQLLGEERGKYDAAKAAVDAAVAKLQTSKARINKAEAEVAVSKAASAVSDARLKAAAHRLEKATTNASFRQLRAPFAGVLMEVDAQLGEFVRPEQNRPLFVVARTDLLRAVVQVPDKDVPLVDRGDPVAIEIDALPGRVYRARVSRSRWGIDPTTRTMRVEIDLPNKDGRLHAGMYGRATITLERGEGALVVPKAAVLTEGDETYCFRVANGRAVKTRVALERFEDAKALLRDGLADGEAVIVLDGNPPSDGQAVEAEE